MKLPPNEKIASIIGNRLVASAIHRPVASALGCPFVHLVDGKSVQDVLNGH